jgi:hypothetical protein
LCENFNDDRDTFFVVWDAVIDGPLSQVDHDDMTDALEMAC